MLASAPILPSCHAYSCSSLKCRHVGGVFGVRPPRRPLGRRGIEVVHLRVLVEEDARAREFDVRRSAVVEDHQALVRRHTQPQPQVAVDDLRVDAERSVRNPPEIARGHRCNGTVRRRGIREGEARQQQQGQRECPSRGSSGTKAAHRLWLGARPYRRRRRSPRRAYRELPESVHIPTRPRRSRLKLAAAACTLMVALLAAWVPATSLADGDPASDVLLTQPIFLPWDAGVSSAQQGQLTALLQAAAHSGYQLRLALIASPSDLGSVTELWRNPAGLRRLSWRGALARLPRHPARRDAQRLRPVPAIGPDGRRTRVARIDPHPGIRRTPGLDRARRDPERCGRVGPQIANGAGRPDLRGVRVGREAHPRATRFLGSSSPSAAC